MLLMMAFAYTCKRPVVCMSIKHIVLLHAYAVLGVVDGHGCQKYTICNACRLCHLILSVLIREATFSPISMDLLCSQLAQVPRSPGLAIFVSIRTELLTTPRSVPGKKEALKGISSTK